MRKVSILFLILIQMSCTKPEDSSADHYSYKQFNSFHEFKSTLFAIASIADESSRDLKVNAFWDSLAANKQIPYVFNDSVAFLYKGSASEVKWAGDFNGWNPTFEGYAGERIGESNIWFTEKVYPLDARLDYKIVRDGSWILDPANTQIQYSGFGPNSELRMPQWEFPSETVLAAGVNRGTLSGNITIQSISQNLGYSVNYKVYTPFGYENLSQLPVIYVTDGHEYADDRLGAMLIVLDNLIHQNRIEPIVAVFIDPREPANTSNNRRATEYTGNINFANFVADELVPAIDAAYKTNPTADKRAILGTSLGGWNSAFFGYSRSETFHLIAIHSPAFDSNIIQSYINSDKLPLKIFMSTGNIFDTQDRARQMKIILDSKQYSLHYVEVSQGHSWGNWRALIDEPLQYFFGLK